MWSSIFKYTLFQKKRNIFEVAFLSEKSVHQWIWGYTLRPYVRVTDPGAPGNMDRSMGKINVVFLYSWVVKKPYNGLSSTTEEFSTRILT